MDIESMPATSREARQLIKNSFQMASYSFGVQHHYRLGQMNINDDGFWRIVKAVKKNETKWKQNQKEVFLILYLNDNVLGEKSCQHLIKNNLINLAYLDLSNNKIGNRGCMHLAKCIWPHLKQINIIKCKIRQKGCSYLSLSNWNNLQFLQISQNKIEKIGRKVLKDRFAPKCTVWCDGQYQQQQ